MNNTKKLLKTILISCLGTVISYLINMFLTSFITDNIGMEAYGFVTLSRTFVGYAGILTIALTSFVVRYISVNYHKGDFKSANSYYSSSFAACFVLGVCINIIAGILTIGLDHLINIPDGLVDSVKILFIIVFLSFFITTISSPFTTGAFIKNKLDIVGIVKIISYIIEAGILVLLFTCFEASIWFVGIGSLSAAAVLLLGNCIITKKCTPELRIKRESMSFSYIKNLVGNGIWNSINQLGNVLNSGLDLLISNLMLSPFATGQISVAKNIGLIFSTLNTTIAQPFQPNLIKAYSKGDNGLLIKEIRRSMRISGYFSSVLLCGFVVLGRLYMKLWLPNQDYDYLFLITIINIGYNMTAGIMQPIYYVSTLTLKNKIPCYLTLVSGVVNVISMWLLLQYTTLGCIAVVGTTTVIMTLINLFFNPLYAARCLKTSAKPFYITIVKHIFAVFSLFLVFYCVNLIASPSSWLGLFITAVVMAAVAFPFYYIITAELNEIKCMPNKIKSKLSRSKSKK